jgi:hypothetical protein
MISLGHTGPLPPIVQEYTMKSSLLLVGALLGASLTVGSVAMAQDAPYVDIGNRHGNLRGAQENIVQAYQLIGTAQMDNNSQLGGHAARAKELLREANEELRLAADVANEHRW